MVWTREMTISTAHSYFSTLRLGDSELSREQEILNHEKTISSSSQKKPAGGHTGVEHSLPPQYNSGSCITRNAESESTHTKATHILVRVYISHQATMPPRFFSSQRTLEQQSTAALNATLVGGFPSASISSSNSSKRGHSPALPSALA